MRTFAPTPARPAPAARMLSTGRAAAQAWQGRAAAAGRDERDADGAAAHVLRMPEPARQGGHGEQQGRGESRLPPSHAQSPSQSQSLSAQERAFFEPRFGHDFSRVRIHADGRSARIADALNAEAFTVGRDIYFGAGKRRPQAGPADPLLAHELAHVQQQAHNGPRLQPKLKLTGTADHLDRVARVLNTGLGSFYYVSVDAAGELKMDPVRGAHTSSITGPSAQVRAVSEPLWSMISESGTTTVAVLAGGVPIVGSYQLSQIDISDMEALGSGQPGWNATASLIHELVEQRQKQLGASAAERAYGSDTTGSHSKGLAAELGVIGAQLESDSGISAASTNPDGTMNGVRIVVFKYPDGTRYRVEVTLTSNNITGVKRVKLP